MCSINAHPFCEYSVQTVAPSSKSQLPMPQDCVGVEVGVWVGVDVGLEIGVGVEVGVNVDAPGGAVGVAVAGTGGKWFPRTSGN